MRVGQIPGSLRVAGADNEVRGARVRSGVVVPGRADEDVRVVVARDVTRAGGGDRPAGAVARRLPVEDDRRVRERRDAGRVRAPEDDVRRAGLVPVLVRERRTDDDVGGAVVVHVTGRGDVPSCTVSLVDAGQCESRVGERARRRQRPVGDDVRRARVRRGPVRVRRADEEVVAAVAVEVLRGRDRPARPVARRLAGEFRVGGRRDGGLAGRRVVEDVRGAGVPAGVVVPGCADENAVADAVVGRADAGDVEPDEVVGVVAVEDVVRGRQRRLAAEVLAAVDDERRARVVPVRVVVRGADDEVGDAVPVHVRRRDRLPGATVARVPVEGRVGVARVQFVRLHGTEEDEHGAAVLRAGVVERRADGDVAVAVAVHVADVRDRVAEGVVHAAAAERRVGVRERQRSSERVVRRWVDGGRVGGPSVGRRERGDGRGQRPEDDDGADDDGAPLRGGRVVTEACAGHARNCRENVSLL